MIFKYSFQVFYLNCAYMRFLVILCSFYSKQLIVDSMQLCFYVIVFYCLIPGVFKLSFALYYSMLFRNTRFSWFLVFYVLYMYSLYKCYTCTMFPCSLMIICGLCSMEFYVFYVISILCGSM